MPAIDYEEAHGGNRRESGRTESAASVLSEMESAASDLSRRSGMTKAKAFVKLMEINPSLYTRYKNAKREDFRG
jgi:hypothetical protein